MTEETEETEPTCIGCPYLRELKVGDKAVYSCVRLPYQECQLERNYERNDCPAYG